MSAHAMGGGTVPRRGLAAAVGSRGLAVPLAAAAAVLLGFALRLCHIGAKPFWLDEVTTLKRVALPLGAMVRDSLSFHHLPTWFVISSAFLGFGDGELALRLPAALFGALSCGLAAIIAGELAGAAPALLAGVLMATSPVEVQYGQEARSYTLILCCVLLAVRGLLMLLRDPERAAAPWRMPGVRSPWICYAVGTLGGLLVLGVAIWWLLIANLAVLLVRSRRMLPRAFVRRWVLAQAGIGVAAAPGFIAMVLLVEQAHGTFKSGLDWIPPLSWHHVGVALAALYGLRVSSLITDRLFASPVPWFGVLVPVLALAGAAVLARRRGQSRAALVLVAGTVALPVLTALVSVAVPLFMPRYVLWSTGPFLVLAGVGVASLPWRTRWPAAMLVAVAAVVNLVPYYRTETKPRWEVAARVLSERLKPGDRVLVADPGTVDMMNVFLARQHVQIPHELMTDDVAAASCALGSGHRVWALFGRVGQVDHEDLPQFLADTAPLGAPAARVRIGLDITLALYDRPPGWTPPQWPAAGGSQTESWAVPC